MTDLKNTLMKLINELPGHEGKTFEEALADHLIANGVTVQRWISVDERLPEKEGWYQVWTKTAQGGFKSFNKAAFYCGEWHGTGGRWGNVTHWMPLPEPPKEVDG